MRSSALSERTALGRAVASAVVRYRTERGLSQRALAGLLGWRQPQVARLELGEHNPTMETLLVLTRKLRLRFAFAVGPPATRCQYVRAKRTLSNVWKTMKAG